MRLSSIDRLCDSCFVLLRVSSFLIFALSFHVRVRLMLAFLCLSLPCMPFSTSASLACLPLPQPPLHAFLYLCLPCVPHSPSPSLSCLTLPHPPLHAFLYLCLPYMPSSTSTSLACLPLPLHPLRASLWLALPCVPPSGLRASSLTLSVSFCLR